ncbi:MAG: serine hydrolase [Pseudomonadota bacterium]
MKSTLLALMLATLVATAVSADDLEGVWSAYLDYGVPARIDIAIEHDDDGSWVAKIGETQAKGQQGDDGTVAFVTDMGTLRLYPQAATAYWVQPYLEMSGSAYANPVDLTADEEGTWRGMARPRPVHLRLDLVVQSTDAGLAANLRNPEYNMGRNMPAMRIEAHDDGTIAFRHEDNPPALHGTRAGDRMDLQFENIDERVTFVRTVTPRPGYAPRSQPVIALTPPAALDDGWLVAVPRSRGVDPDPLLALTQRVAEQDPGNLYGETVHTMVLTQGGVVVYEEGFFGHDPRVPHDTRSAGKSFSSTMVGLAIQQGYAISPSTTLADVFGDEIPASDKRKRAITAAHLMSMASGLDCDDGNYESPGNEDVMQSQQAQRDWIRYTLDLDMVRAPGEKAIYCSAGVNLASTMVARVTGRWLPEFFDQQFAKPLGIRHYHINLMPTGDMYVGGGVYMTARDLAKFGQLYLNDGVWNGERLLPEGWVGEAFSAVASINGPDDYGWNWWRQSFEVDGQRIEARYAAGNGGQLTFVLPQLDAVFVVQAGNYGNYGTWRRFRDEYLPDYVIPALLARSASTR